MVLNEKEAKLLKFVADKKLVSSVELRKYIAENSNSSEEGERILKRLQDLEFIAELDILFDKSYIITNKGLDELKTKS